MNFDVIGDVHGEFDKLVELLAHLGYSESDGVWAHPSRTAIFVGDLIDRGPKQLETVHLVRAMVESGGAQCILGNHEFNAIAWVTPDPEDSGKVPAGSPQAGNREQHQAFWTSLKGRGSRGTSRIGSRHCRCGWTCRVYGLCMRVGMRNRWMCCTRSWDRIETLTEEAILWGSRKGHRHLRGARDRLQGS